MNTAFGIALTYYEAPLPASAPRTRPSIAAPGVAGTHTHHGYDGAVHLPPQLVGVVLAVVGLDNRSIGVPGGGAGDPSGATSLSVPSVAKLYNFPNTGAPDQTIGVLALETSPGKGASYLADDINSRYFPGLSDSSYQTAPASINDINLKVGTNTYSNSPATVQGITSSTNLNSFPYSFILELTQDISTSATIAQGATVNVYFTESSEQGWVTFLNRVLQPPQGENQPTVVTCSFTMVLGDDSSYIGLLSDSASVVSVMTALFQKLATAGINFFIAQGDWGADDWWLLDGSPPTPPDGKSHVMYPGSDPWVTSCGGTILAVNPNPPPAINESVWSDAWSSSLFGSNNSNFGATGGGVSATFPAPPYQTSARITGATDSAGKTHAGRGVPDVAGMVSYSGNGADDWFYVNGITYNFTGTSCVAPLYAGLAAVLRSAFGEKIGVLNTMLYPLLDSAFNDVTTGNNDSRDTPANVKIVIPGDTGTTPDAPYFSAGRGWDACSGLGSIDGTKLLNGLAGQLYQAVALAPAWSSSSGQVVLASGFNGRLEVFCVMSDGTLGHSFQTAPNNGWSRWFNRGGTGIEQIAVGRDLNGCLEVFAVLSDGTVSHTFQTAPNNGWSAWYGRGGTGIEQIAMGRDLNGCLEVWAVLSDGTVSHTFQTAPNNGWSAWYGRGGTGIVQIAMGRDLNGCLEVWAVLSDGTVIGDN